jgi:hypothetical protein
VVALPLPILIPLTPNFIFSQRIIVAGSVEIDDVTVARILENRTIPIKGLFFDCRELQTAEGPGGIGNFGNEPSAAHRSGLSSGNVCPPLISLLPASFVRFI